MIEHKEHFHGSDLEKIEKYFGIRKEDIVSFSANVNPLGISPLVKEKLIENIDVISSYPDREYTALRSSIASYLGDEKLIDKLVLANGATELISLFISFATPKHALILAPTYSEYEHEVSKCGGKSSYYMLDYKKDFSLDITDLKNTLVDSKSKCDLLIICNPNNPTGTALSKNVLSDIVAFCKENNIYVMIDETYVEFCENVDEITAVGLTNDFENLIVLRGTSKFFAAPGLRLGYAVLGSMDLISKINEKINAWSINSLAALAGEIMYQDTEYISSTRNLISFERDRLYTLFNESSRFKPYIPTANFMLLEILDQDLKSGDLFERCIKHGLMIRDCSTFDGLSDKFIRFCFMNKSDNDRLVKVLLED